MKFNLTRIAPTPSGFLHLGNAYSFLLTKALAEKTGAKILLRIDDLDRERFRMEYLVDIFETLDFLEINYDIGPKNPEDFLVNWSQLNRLEAYKEAIEKLWEAKALFACTCSRRKISELNSSGYYLGHCQNRNIPKIRKDTSWRFDSFSDDLISIFDIWGKKKEEVLPEDVAFSIVRKKDGLPSYQLSSLIDDLGFGVDMIVRGRDLYSSSLAQLQMAEKLGVHSFLKTAFHHHPLLKGLDGKKLSKSEGVSSIQSLRKSGKNLNNIFAVLGQLIKSPVPISNFEEFKTYLTS